MSGSLRLVVLLCFIAVFQLSASEANKTRGVLDVMLPITMNLVKSWVLIEKNNSGVLTRTMEPEELLDPDEVMATERFTLIYPDTNWCGVGNIAEGYEDLGTAAETDICCRDHDYCPEVIPAGWTKHNLTNNVNYSRRSCRCDLEFRWCLRQVNSKTSNNIGVLYFNVIGTQCYRKYYPIIGCKKRGGWRDGKCLEYEYDTQSEKKYQWFDVPNF